MTCIGAHDQRQIRRAARVARDFHELGHVVIIGSIGFVFAFGVVYVRFTGGETARSRSRRARAA